MPGADNMALDSEILSRYLEDNIPVLRLYRWLTPSFTYGISQDPAGEIDIKRCAEDGISVAGRMTGGGVLFHDDDITYSFVCARYAHSLLNSTSRLALKRHSLLRRRILKTSAPRVNSARGHAKNMI